MKTETHHLAEYVSPGHPDRLADAIAEALVDYAVAQDPLALVGVEVAVHTHQVFIDGRIAWRSNDGPPRPPVADLVRDVYRQAGYGDCWKPEPQSLIVTDDLCREVLCEDEAQLRRCSDDQNIVCGFATPDAKTNQLPPAHFVANQIGRRLCQWRKSGTAEIGGKQCGAQTSLGPDFKLLPHLVQCADHSKEVRWRWQRLTLSIQHVPGLYYEDQHRTLFPILKATCEALAKETGLVGLEDLKAGDVFLNGAGDFHVGGPQGDNGLSGKKLVADHYGPEVPIGGGALCGKDPHKIDRVGPLRARQLARQLARAHDANALVRLAWSPGDCHPYFVEAWLDRDGRQTRLADNHLPPLDWFSIETIFADLRLQEVQWRKAVNAGYFANPEFSWES